MTLITEKQLAVILPKNKEISAWTESLNSVLPKYDINTTKRVAAFIAQCAHESAQFTVVRENLNYSAVQLNKVFSKYFVKAGRDANKFARQPEKIANIVYANRMGNVNEGDGWKHRGRGLIQLTGFTNYSLFAAYKKMTVDEAIAYVETKQGAIDSACWFWSTNGLNRFADAGNMITLTERINGGRNGLEDRIKYYNVSLRVLGGMTASTSSVQENTKSLAVGSRGQEVVRLQTALGLNADGAFGPKTREAVMTFQLRNGLPANGIADFATLNKIFNK